ncbi:sugar transporter domain-containing protein [Phthorimaea operculella]|nr:sugar transporter domain-containing protein [Phthorimaea operculella]
MEEKSRKTDYELETNKNDIEEDKPKIDLMMTLTKDIGAFGLYQFRVIVIAAVVTIFIGFNNNQYLFTAARINTRCFVSDCDKHYEIEFSPPWLKNAIPRSSEYFDNCNLFLKEISNITVKENTCPADLFDNDTVIPCETYVYENTDTVVYDFNLACDEWRRTLIGSLRIVGTLIGLPITGYISDRFGRRTGMVILLVYSAFVGTVRIFAQTYIGFILSQVFEAIGYGAFQCAYVMSIEIVGTKYREVAGATITSANSVGQILLGSLAWVLPNWRNMTKAIYLPQFLGILCIWIMPENHRWYLSKGRYEDAERVLTHAAQVNRKELSDESKKALKIAAEENILKKQQKNVINDKEPPLITLVFKHPPVLFACIASSIWYITATLIFYGLSINAVHLAGNSYENYMLVSFVEIPGYAMSLLLLNKFGRKPVLIVGYWVCAACMVGSIFITKDIFVLYIGLYLLGKLCISIVVLGVYVYVVELFPTKYRHSLFAFSTMVGRFGQIVAPLMPAFSAEIWVHLPFVLFATMAFISGALGFLTPETLGADLPDTMEEAVNVDARRRKI